jgi:hypothetical protein
MPICEPRFATVLEAPRKAINFSCSGSAKVQGGQRAQRHALVDTDGRCLVIEPHPASIQDRDGGGPLLQASRRIFPFIQRVFADSG